MKLGFLNACLLEWPPERAISFAAENGFTTIELHGGPRYEAASWTAVASGDRDAIARIRKPLEAYGVSCSGIMYGRLPYLDGDPQVRSEAAGYLTMLIRAAANLDVAIVSTFAGRAIELDLGDNIKLFKEVFSPIVELAERTGVTIALENCAMTNGFAPATNIAYAPSIWVELFKAVPSAHLGLNFDPSHLQWMGADVVRAVEAFGDRIVHFQAKDAEVLRERLAETTILADGWWRYRLPGYGEVPWSRVFSALRSIGYDGAVSIEHEDPVFSDSEGQIVDGLRRAAEFLRPFL